MTEPAVTPDPPPRPGPMPTRIPWTRRLDPFIVGILLMVLVATLLPAQGQVLVGFNRAVKIAIALLFFLYGARLSPLESFHGLRHWRLHATVLAATFVLFPLLGLGARVLVPSILPEPLYLGIFYLCLLPSTVQSSIAFTSVARGNVGATVASAAASNLIGIALTPALLGLMIHAQPGEGGVSFSGVWKIVLQLLLPFAVGHLLRPWLGPWAARQKAVLTYTDRGTIVLAVYSAFSAAVLAGIWSQVPLSRLLILVGLCAVLLALIMLATHFAARALGFSTEDEISILFCGSQKSLVSGVPMARVLFAGPAVGAAVLPVMIFHQMQLMVCAWLARRYAARPGATGDSEDR